MYEQIYMVLATIEFFFVMRIIARYIFLEPKLGKGAFYSYVCMVLASIAAYLIWGEVVGISMWILCSGMSFSMARKKHRIRGFFLVIPILGVIFGMIMPFIYAIQLLTASAEQPNRYDWIVDVILVLLLVLFLCFGKNWRARFEQELQFRKLQSWERSVLMFAGYVALLLCMAGMELQELNISVTASVKFLIFVIYVTVFVSMISVIGFVWRGNKKFYYEGIAKINEHYLELEVQHFEAYKLTQQEVRKMQHDMKHHVACLQHLCRQRNIDEIQNYLEDISGELERGDMEINCGHVLASSICTHKANLAAQKRIDLQVNGRIPEQIALLSVDLCTILSNALDNAIEACEQLEQSKRWIQLEMSSKGNLLFFRFSNPIKKEIKQVKLGISSKKDIAQHGFGLQNIKYAVEKYNGQMLIEIEEEEEPVFVLSVMVGELDNTTKE